MTVPQRSVRRRNPAATRLLDTDGHRAEVKARRNILFGLWAARRLELPPAEHESYAWSVHFADLEEPGDGDLVGKVSRDLAERGAGLSDRRIRHHLHEMELRAYLQLSAREPRAA